KLRHPVYLGLRDDKQPKDVVREKKTRLHGSSKVRIVPPRPARAQPAAAFDPAAIVDQLHAIERGGGNGVLDLPDARLHVTNLRKVFWPRQKLTKGALFRSYAAVSPYLLPAIADRPLVMKRYPNGVAAKPFYQHRAEQTPPGVRVEPVAAA